mmetsp:Transcript_50128/g.160389  ORF Transcript_50128/g.160389 Transcript_50128/m.160389 type:complete len:389 (-) Transcript_50128:230-1396(-)
MSGLLTTLSVGPCPSRASAASAGERPASARGLSTSFEPPLGVAAPEAARSRSDEAREGPALEAWPPGRSAPPWTMSSYSRRDIVCPGRLWACSSSPFFVRPRSESSTPGATDMASIMEGCWAANFLKESGNSPSRLAVARRPPPPRCSLGRRALRASGGRAEPMVSPVCCIESFLKLYVGAGLLLGSLLGCSGWTQMRSPLLSYVKGLFFIWSFTWARRTASSASSEAFRCRRCSSSRFLRASRSFMSRMTSSSSSSSCSSVSGIICALVGAAARTSDCSSEAAVPPARDGDLPAELLLVEGAFAARCRRLPSSAAAAPFGRTSFLRIGTQARAHVSTRQRGGSGSSVQLSRASRSPPAHPAAAGRGSPPSQRTKHIFSSETRSCDTA